jgi:hypothetical protein
MSREAAARHWHLQYLKVPGDVLHLASPLAFPPDSLVLRSWLDELENWITQPCRVGSQQSFAALIRAVQRHGLEHAIAEVEAVSPVSRFAGQSPLRASAAGFDREVIFKALAVNNFWYSSTSFAGQSSIDRCELNPEPGSLWDDLLRKAMPPPTHRLVAKVGYAADGQLRSRNLVVPLSPPSPASSFSESPCGRRDVEVQTDPWEPVAADEICLRDATTATDPFWNTRTIGTLQWCVRARWQMCVDWALCG